jgi:cystathionine gamma-synthase
MVKRGIEKKGKGTMNIETLAIHADHSVDALTGAIMPPIHLSTTFERAADGSYPGGYEYIREHNPTRKALEDMLCALEDGSAAAAFSSGMAATMSILQALPADGHVVAPLDAYFGTTHLLHDLSSHQKLSVTFVEMTDLEQIQQAMRPTTQLIWVETPSNPLLAVTDLAQVAALAHERGVLLACDNTWATPVFQHPFQLGADVVMHSMTKYLGGHSDVLGGAVIVKDNEAFFERIKAIQRMVGAVPSPFDCWLVLRGIRTLPYRMQAHAEHALAIATFLHKHPQVEAVHYPGLPTHPQHRLASQQMTGFGGMVSFQLRGGREEAFRVAANVHLFTRGTSLGGVESLIEHRASIEGPTTRTPDNLLRLSIGLEHPHDLIEDLTQALEGAKVW